MLHDLAFANCLFYQRPLSNSIINDIEKLLVDAIQRETEQNYFNKLYANINYQLTAVLVDGEGTSYSILNREFPNLWDYMVQSSWKVYHKTTGANPETGLPLL